VPASKQDRGSLLKLSIEITPEAEDAATQLLENIFGGTASVYCDLERQQTLVSIFVSALSSGQRAQVIAGLKKIRRVGLNVGPEKLRVRRLRRENWAESWKRHFKPLEISARLVVLPSWSKQKAKRGQAKVILDPGLSFGTGHHPTTAFCLEQIATLRVEGPRSLLDIGCGSGILSIAAAKLGYSPVVAFDFDADAVRVAKENFAVNRVHILISQRDLTRLPQRSNRRFNVVCANLIYDLLIQERDTILNRLSAEGRLVLAGILDEQFPKVQRCYESAGVKLVAARTVNEWRSGAFQFCR
jgi:ribosomal protein L11 methyltransferase